MRLKLGCLAVLGLLAAATNAPAATMSFEGSAVAATPFVSMNSGVSTGNSVLWNGSIDLINQSSGSVTGGTLTAAQVLGFTGSVGTNNEFRLVLNVDEPNGQPSFTVSALSAVFQNAAGNTLFTATLGAPQTVTGDPPQSFGFLVDFSTTEAALFFGSAGGHLGLTFDLADNQGQADSFGISQSLPGGPNLGDVQINPTLTDPTPEPATMLVFGLMGLAGLRYSRRRKAA